MSMMYRTLEGVCELSAGSLEITGLPPVFEGEIAAVQVTVQTKLNGQSYTVPGGIRAEMYLHDHYGKRMSKSQKMNISGDTLSAAMPEEFGAFVGRPLLVIRLTEESSGRILVACAKEISIRCTLGQVVLGLKSVSPSEVVYVGRAPYIAGGKWMVWDSGAGAYVDSGVQARGPKGDPGDVTQEQFGQLSQQIADYRVVKTLVVNGDFKNPINQRGKTSHSGASYGLDRWTGYTSGSSQTINAGHVTFKGQVRQYFADITSFLGKDVTVACKLADGTTFCASGTVPDDLTETSVTVCNVTLGSGKYLRFIVSSAVAYVVVIATSGDVSVAWVDLYEGDFTLATLPPHVTPDPRLELLKCQERFHVYETQAARPSKPLDCCPPMILAPEQEVITQGTVVTDDDKTLYYNYTEL